MNFDGDAKWFYRMIFSEDLSQIEGGEVLSYDADGQKGDWHTYNDDLIYVRQQDISLTYNTEQEEELYCVLNIHII